MPEKVSLLDVSIVIPVRNESENIPRLHAEISIVMAQLGKNYEVVFVNDASTDNTFYRLSELSKQDSCIKVIHLAKSFGKASALNAGLMAAQGDIIITMDGDLQDDPQEIPRFLGKINEGFDLVSGWRIHRKDRLTAKFSSRIFNFAVSSVAGIKIHDPVSSFKCYRKEVARRLKLHGGFHRYTPVFVAAGGFKIGEIKINHRARIYGASKYGPGKMIQAFFDFFTILLIVWHFKRQHAAGN